MIPLKVWCQYDLNLCKKENVSYIHQGCIYLNKNTVKTATLLHFITVKNVYFYSIPILISEHVLAV